MERRFGGCLHPQVAALHQPVDGMPGLFPASEQGTEVGHGVPAVGHQQHGALALAQRALSGAKFVSGLVGLEEMHGEGVGPAREHPRWP